MSVHHNPADKLLFKTVPLPDVRPFPQTSPQCTSLIPTHCISLGWSQHISSTPLCKDLLRSPFHMVELIAGASVGLKVALPPAARSLAVECHLTKRSSAPGQKALALDY